MSTSKVGAGAINPLPSCDDEDSDDEIGAWIYQSSKTAKEAAAAEESSVANCDDGGEDAHGARSNQKRKPFDRGEGRLRPKRSRTRTQFYLSPVRSGEEVSGGEAGGEADLQMKGIEGEETIATEVKKIGLGDVGYEFRKKFDEGWFTGTVTEILPVAGEALCSMRNSIPLSPYV